MNDERPDQEDVRSDDEDVHQVVRELATGLGVKTAAGLADASNLPEPVMFAGFRGPVIKHPERGEWRLLYLDLELTEWVLIETAGILRRSTVEDKTVPFDERSRDVFWVKADAAVGRGNAAQTVQAQFLTGKFTRAADFDAPLSGGTIAAATGVFCEARTPSCCRIRSRPYYP